MLPRAIMVSDYSTPFDDPSDPSGKKVFSEANGKHFLGTCDFWELLRRQIFLLGWSRDDFFRPNTQSIFRK